MKNVQLLSFVLVLTLLSKVGAETISTRESHRFLQATVSYREKCGNFPKRRWILFGDFVSSCGKFSIPVEVLNEKMRKSAILKYSKDYFLYYDIRDSALDILYVRKIDDKFFFLLDTTDLIEAKKFCSLSTDIEFCNILNLPLK